MTHTASNTTSIKTTRSVKAATRCRFKVIAKTEARGTSLCGLGGAPSMTRRDVR